MRYRIRGADSKTGKDVALAVEASGLNEAEAIANAMGIFVSGPAQSTSGPGAIATSQPTIAAVSGSVCSPPPIPCDTQEVLIQPLPLLWNPNAAACWCLLFPFIFDFLWVTVGVSGMFAVFSPISGAWLHAKNWRALGRPDKARQNMYWVWSLPVAFILLLAMKASMLLPEIPPILLGLLVVAIWNFSLARSQAKYVKTNFTQGYRCRSFLLPIGLAFFAMAALGVVYVGLNELVLSGAITSPEMRTLAQEEFRLASSYDKMMQEAQAGRLRDDGIAKRLREEFIPAYGRLSERAAALAASQTSRELEEGSRFYRLQMQALQVFEEGLRTHDEQRVRESASLMKAAQEVADRIGKPGQRAEP